MSDLTSYTNPLLRGWRVGGRVPKPKFYYRIMRWVSECMFGLPWNARVFGRRNEPATGGVLYVANHQSFLDPMLVSMMLRRAVHYMARDSLFRIPIFGKFIYSLNAFPVKRGSADLGAIKEAMRRLRAGHQLLIFAEGTRTPDGRIGPLLPGVTMLAQRAAEWIVPVIIDGAHEAWPRTRLLPGAGSIVVQYGKAIPCSQVRDMPSQELLVKLRDMLIAMQADVRQRLGRPALKY